MHFQFTSPLVKARLDDRAKYFKPYRQATALRGECFYFSAVYDTEGLQKLRRLRCAVKITSPLAPYITVYRVDQVPVRMAHYPDSGDGDYIGHEPGLYPDLLRPADTVYLQWGVAGQLYFELNLPAELPADTYTIKVALIGENEEMLEDTFTLTVLPAVLPPQKVFFTNWFHYDCLATHYHVEVFSERHWEIVESFLRTAVKIGINTLLTPVFTPPLDTQVGGERPTVQLVDITVQGGKYTFGFEKLQRFCQMCLRCGVQLLEIAHLFTQWGAEHAPKIMATVDGEYKRIFGWETDATGAEYIGFLNEFIPAVKEKLDEYGYKDRYFFHISDEPSEKHLASYKAARDAAWPLICDHPVRDALSHYEFYEQGIVTGPVPIVKTADVFVKNNVPDLWVYYCCSPGVACTNRFIAMSANRTRVLGAQMYRTGSTGFLHWGYNFYYNRYSLAPVDPFTNTDGDYFAPAGDTFLVYPDIDGNPLPSLRSALMEQAMQDMRAMALAEEVSGKEAVMAAIDRAGITDFLHYSTDPQALLQLREEINRLATKQ
ncbi:MAG: DUF4091 domain-containing protein [Ruminococcaceae bacterium]|nr:DUF4091 domain-containing protein [Oscillospiraceae bacterium]